MSVESPIKPYWQRFKNLQKEADTWLPTWRDISDYSQPRRGRYLERGLTTGVNKNQSNDGRTKHQRIINGSTADALRVIAAGLQGGLTSPARPWFNLALEDRDLMEFGPVKEWLQEVRNLILNAFSISNIYGALHGGYYELAGFGTMAMSIEEDFMTMVRARPYTIGEYYLALDSRYRPEALYRQFDMTARQMIEEFGADNVSDTVRRINESNSEEWFPVIQVIEKNLNRVSGKLDNNNMPYVSKYFQVGDNERRFLRESGYKTIPFVAPRWSVTGVDVYGSGPGHDSLGDMKMLQKMEEKKLKALDKLVDPPMNAPASMKQQGGTIIAGGVNYLDTTQGQQRFEPAYQINPDLRSMAFEIENVENRIKRFFYNDLFLTILGNPKTMTATEVAERHEEKLIMLGPVTERLQAELHDPLIDRVYSIMEDRNAFPPPPEELQGKNLKIEYISLLAQAQKLIGTDAIERTANFVGAMAQVNPEVVDKFDADEAVEQYADFVGVNPKIIRSKDEVSELRRQRQEAQLAQQRQEQLMQASSMAKDLGSVKLDENTALDKANELVGGANA